MIKKIVQILAVITVQWICLHLPLLCRLVSISRPPPLLGAVIDENDLAIVKVNPPFQSSPTVQPILFTPRAAAYPPGEIFLKWANPGLFFIYFRLFKHSTNFTTKNVENVHPVYSAGI